MSDKTRPLTPSEKDYEKKLEENALEEMRDKKMLEESGSAYDKAKQQSLGAPDKAPAKPPVKKRAGGMCKGYAKGGSVKSSASRRADGCAQRGKTKGRMV